MLYEIHVWVRGEWSPHTTMGGFSAENAIDRMRKGGAKGVLRAVLMSDASNQGVSLERARPLPMLDHPQPKRHHKDKRTKYSPAERFYVMTPLRTPDGKPLAARRKARVIDLSSPSRRDIRYK